MVDVNTQKTLEDAFKEVLDHQKLEKEQPELFVKKTKTIHIDNDVEVIEDIDPKTVTVSIPTATTLPQGVFRFLEQFKHAQERASQECLRVAEQLEKAAVELRNRAAVLNHQATQIPEDVSASVMYEREAFHLAQSWKFVNFMPNKEE